MELSPGFLLIDFEPQFLSETIDFIDNGYKFLGYTGLELETLDNDLNDIELSYVKPSCFKLLINNATKEIAGSIAVKIDLGKKEAELKRVFVDPKCQGMGLGRKLSEWAFNYAREQSANKVHIWSGTLCDAAHKMYLKLGALDTGEYRFIGGCDSVREKYFCKVLI